MLPGIARTRAKGYKGLGLRLGLRLGLKCVWGGVGAVAKVKWAGGKLLLQAELARWRSMLTVTILTVAILTHTVSSRGE